MKPTLALLAVLLLFAGSAYGNGGGRGHGGYSHYSGSGYSAYDNCRTESEYVNYDDAVAMGKEMQAERHVSLGEVARQIRAKKAQAQAAAAAAAKESERQGSQSATTPAKAKPAAAADQPQKTN